MIPRSRRRLFGLYVLTVAAVVVLGGRLWYLQVLDTTQYKALAAGEPDQADRGARGARHDHRRHRHAVGAQRDRDGRLGQHAGPVPAHHRRRRGRAQEAGAAAPPVGQDAGREGQALHPRRSPAVLDRVAVPAGPGRGARQRRDRAADHGGAEGLHRRHRVAPAGDRLPDAGRRQPGPGARLPAADHPVGDGGRPHTGDRLRRRRPGRPGRPRGAVQHRADRQARQPDRLRERGRRRAQHRRRHLRADRRHARHLDQRQGPGGRPAGT